MQPSNLRKQLRCTVSAWNPIQLGRCPSRASLSLRLCGLQSERPLQRQASRASKTRLCSAERALPRPVENWRAHPPAQLSICLVFCGVWNRAVRSGWQRKIRARQIPKRCGRTLRKQVWVSAWTGNLPCFKPLCTVCTPCALL